MGVITTGQTFASGDQVTATKLNDIANNCTFTSAADTTDNSTLTLGSSKLKVKDAGITSTQLATDSVITAKIQDGAVTAAKLDAGAVSVLMPTGSIMAYAGAAAPTGYLLCDGAAIARQAGGSDTALFELIGTTYGSGDGSTTYNIPDLRGRVIAGQDDMGGASANRLTGLTGGVDGDVLGGTGGEEGQTLTTSQLASHSHFGANYGGTGTAYLNAANQKIMANGNDGGSASYHFFRTTDTPNTATTSDSGGGTAHNNVQPTIILNYIIKD
jgi:microcystin-dependent protein